MEKILNLLEEYIIVLNLSYNIEFCNEKILSKLKCNMSDLKNNSINSIAKINISEIYEACICNKEIDLEIIDKQGNKLYLNCYVVLENNDLIYIIGKEYNRKFYDVDHLEKILNNLPLNCWLKNMNGEYIYMNESYANEIKDSKRNILGNKTSNYWDEKNSDIFTQMDKEVIESKKYQLTQNSTKQNNSDLWVEVYKAPIMNERNAVEYIVGYTRDITLQKELENKLYINNKEINNLNNILLRNNSKRSVSDLLNEMGDSILNYLECDGISILLANKEKTYLDIVANCGKLNSSKNNEKIFEFHKSIENEGKSKCLNTIVNIDQVDNKALKEYMLFYNIDNIGVYEISFNNEVIGYLLLKYLKNNNLKYNKFDYLKTICEYIAITIKSHTLSEELKEEFEKRKIIEKELESFLDISVDLIGRGNLKGEIKHINNNWSKTLGWSEKELLNMNFNDLICIDLEFGSIKMRDLNEDEGCVRNKLKCKDGTYKWVEINYKILKSEDAFIITAKDISQQRKQEEERKKLEKAIQLESFKNQFFANISHEFRTPLNIVLGTMQLMQRNIQKNKINWDKSIDLESHVNYIKQNSYRLLRLVNNLIDITRIDSGYYELQLGNYNIIDIVEDITMSVAEYMNEQDLYLVFDTDCEEKIIACDPDKIERIMLNLLSNAIKYTDKNGTIFVDMKVKDDVVQVFVKDEGIGIAEHKVNLVFDRFKKIDNSLNRKCEGSGIGLSLVKSLVELHDGDVSVKSELGKGSEFLFELPIKVLENNEEIILEREIIKNSQIEKCNIEFSDIYS